MLMEKERQDVVEYGKRMQREGLTKGTGGNISIYNSELKYMAIGPSGIAYEDTRPEDVVIMTLDGQIIDGDKKPSSEHSLHSEIYKSKPDTRAVVHTHSMYCVVMSCLNIPLRAVHYVIADTGAYMVPVAPYRTYGTQELAEVVCSTMGENNAVLMANHGMLACGESISSAFGVASTCEWIAEIQWKCMSVGEPNILSDSDMNVVLEKFKGYGQAPGKNTVNGYFK